jgi:hypothetical protein
VIHRISASQEGESSVNIPDAGEAFQLLAARGSGEGATTDPRVDPDAACMRAGADSTQHSALSAQSAQHSAGKYARAHPHAHARTLPVACLATAERVAAWRRVRAGGMYKQTNHEEKK